MYASKKSLSFLIVATSSYCVYCVCVGKKSTPENIAKAEISEWLASAGLFIWHQEAVGIFDPRRLKFRPKAGKFKIRGVSDILGVLPYLGTLLAIEIKQPDRAGPSGKINRYRASKPQKVFLSIIKSHGGISFVAKTIEDARNGLQNCGIEIYEYSPRLKLI